MPVFTGILGSVSAGNSQLSHILGGTASMGSEPMEFDLDLQGQEFDTTAFSALGISTFLNGLPSWTAQIRGRMKTAQTGDQGLINWTTASSNYETNIKRYSIVLETDAFESTAFGSTPPTWRTYIPGKFRWGIDFDGYLDDADLATIPMPLSGSTTPTGTNPDTITARITDLGTDNDLSGTAFTTRAAIEVSPNGIATISYSGRGSGALTQSTPTGTVTHIFPTGAIARPTAGSLTLTATTGQTFTANGTTGHAFWTRIAVAGGVNELMTVTVDLQGTGVLAIA